MKALSLTQPWATLVAIGAKQVETRSWRTHYRGWMAIHAAAGFPQSCREQVMEEPFRSALVAGGCDVPWGTAKLAGYLLPRGSVVAVARLVDCRMTGLGGQLEAEWIRKLSDNERSFGDYSPGRYGWILDDVRPFPEPIPARGALGLWEWNSTADQLAQVNLIADTTTLTDRLLKR